ncbi:lactoylglutathione lyase [Kiloniella laminariae]|uniref:lactoylglutathione lyase n=1 Tax=Kiloniella laminariae TaxID=454162 RepID=UPI000685A8B5|nr:lactoylglutathione lyase [Kiloniella laminariae]
MTENITGGASAPPPFPTRVLHSMLRVGNLERSLAFYRDLLGMQLFRKEDYSSGRFTLAFLGYETEASATVLELTHNWDQANYQPGAGYGHLALAVVDIHVTCQYLQSRGVTLLRAAGPMSFQASENTSKDIIAFIQDPDGYQIELIEKD